VKPLVTRDPFRVGIVALVLGLLAAIGIVVLSVASFGTSSYTAVLEHSAGLRAGEDVQVHGVSVGTVRDVELEGRQVVVTFDLDGDIDLGDQSTAEVKVATLLGTHYLQVDPAGSGELADGVIPLERTSVPYNLQDVLEQGAVKLGELDPVVLARALTEAAEVLDVAGDDIGPALDGVGRLSKLVSIRSEQTGTLLQMARDVTEQLADSSVDLVDLMESTNLVLDEVNSRRAAIERLLRETTSLTDALTRIIDQTDAEMGPSLRKLDLALATLNEEDDQLRGVLEAMAPALRYVANATGNGPFGDLYGYPPVVPTDDMLCKLGDCP